MARNRKCRCLDNTFDPVEPPGNHDHDPGEDGPRFDCMVRLCLSLVLSSNLFPGKLRVGFHPWS